MIICSRHNFKPQALSASPSINLLRNNYLLPQLKIIPGPKLPIKNLTRFTMVTSPTGRGVVIIGGSVGQKIFKNIIELSGTSIDSLKWTFLDQKLRFGRHSHLTFQLPNDVYNDLMQNNNVNGNGCDI